MPLYFSEMFAYNPPVNLSSVCSIYTQLLWHDGWLRSTVVECRSLAGELFLSCARPAVTSMGELYLFYSGTLSFSCFCSYWQIEQQKVQKKHKHKKKKKKKHKNSESSSDEDDDLLRQYLSIVNRKKSAETPSQKRELASPDKAGDKLQQSSDRSLHDKHQRPTSDGDGDGDETRRAHHQFPEKNRHQQKTTHASSSVDNTKRKHSRQSRDDCDRDKSMKDRSDRVHDEHNRDRTKSKQKPSADSDNRNSCDDQHSHSKRRSKDLHRRRSSEAEKETAESVCRARHGSSSGDERPDNSRGNVAGYGLIVSWKLSMLQP